MIEYLLRTETAASLRVIRDPGVDLHVPALCDVEVVAAIRRALLRGLIDLSRATEALDDYLDLPLGRHDHQVLLPRILELRANFGAYDACYIALAERVGAELLTADRGLARATSEHTNLTVLP